MMKDEGVKVTHDNQSRVQQVGKDDTWTMDKVQMIEEEQYLRGGAGLPLPFCYLSSHVHVYTLTNLLPSTPVTHTHPSTNITGGHDELPTSLEGVGVTYPLEVW